MPRTPTVGIVLAQEKTANQHANTVGAALSKNLEKQDLFSGMVKIYHPRQSADEDPTVFKAPPQAKQVQFRVEPDALDGLKEALGPAMDLTAAKEWGNQGARADITVDGKKLFEAVPAAYLLNLEHKLDELHAVLRKVPVLDSAEKWEPDTTTGIWRTAEPDRTVREEKTEVPSIGHQGSQHHAPQVKWLPKSVPTGTYETTKFSGAVEPKRKEELIKRVHDMKQAIHRAREEANQAPAPVQDIGTKLLDYLFA